MGHADVLFQPFTCKGLTLPNRIAMAPMTRLKSSNQVPDAGVAAYYRRRAEGGVGLILTEGTSPEDTAASGYRRCPAFFGEAALAGWKTVADEVHAAGGFIMPQLWHVGMMREERLAPYPERHNLSPSGLATPQADPSAPPMTDGEIADVIAGFAKSAGYAKDLGFDGVEIHGAHGYLIDYFFWAEVNRRTDRYGGSLENRQRFAAEIVAATRKAVGPDFPILLRFSQFKQQDYEAKLAATPAELEAFLSPLVDAGVDILHASTRRFWEPEFGDDGSGLNLAGWAKKLTGKPSMSVGSVSLDGGKAGMRDQHIDVTGIDNLIAMMERGDFDLIAIGRALIANPDWANRVREGGADSLAAFEPAMLETLA